MLKRILILVLVWLSVAPAVFAQAKPSGPEKAPPAAVVKLELTQPELGTLDNVMTEAQKVDKELELARAKLEAAQNRADVVRQQFELTRLKVCQTRKLDPDLYELLLLPTTLPNGQQAQRWTLRLRDTSPPTAPPAPASGGTAP